MVRSAHWNCELDNVIRVWLANGVSGLATIAVGHGCGAALQLRLGTTTTTSTLQHPSIKPYSLLIIMISLLPQSIQSLVLLTVCFDDTIDWRMANLTAN